MAKNSQSSSDKKNRVCEKIFRAVTSPVRTVRRISTKPSSSPSHSSAEAVRVKFAESSTQAAAKPIITKMKMEPKKTVIARVETTIKTDERFTDYIKKAKLKIRATTNHGDHHITNGDDAWETDETRDDHHQHHHVHISHVGSSGRSSDQFSEYIKKAKMKLMSSSTIARANPTFK
ncbi:hypothetical protein CARUB_v10024553mg [Capsella rubella]|uniref:Uncharacterized protein n=1 Tax=Capsella rubella TaxID=81985 RepID=R0HW97_9BRAS|nr:uncharacterized protein LOC17889669 [Capsella rubella]EOA28348.1 hypothetical protein CARUB_v10024553mg [Capsella rubella]